MSKFYDEIDRRARLVSSTRHDMAVAIVEHLKAIGQVDLDGEEYDAYVEHVEEGIAEIDVKVAFQALMDAIGADEDSDEEDDEEDFDVEEEAAKHWGGKVTIDELLNMFDD